MINLDWPRILEESPLDWLLEESNPSVRYFTLGEILNKSESDPQVEHARRAISRSQTVVRILAKQNPEGHWEEPGSPYHPKYRSSYWQIMTLGQLGVGRTDERIGRACEYVFQFQLEEGGFSSHSPSLASKEYNLLQQKGKKMSAKQEWVSAKVNEHQYSCLTGNMSAALIRIGFAEDSRVKKALKWLVKIQNKDGGWLCPYWHAHIRDTHGCFYAAVCALEAFSEVTKKEMPTEMKQTIVKGAEFLLKHRLFKADHHDYKVINRSWLTFGFPWFYGYNILRGLDVLTKLGYVADERLEDAI